jgi:ABC-2 type transport system permease protein
MLAALRFAWTLAGKDLRLYFRDKGGMALGFLLPIALVAVFGSVMGAFAGDGAMKPQQLRIADLDQSASSKKLVESLGSNAVKTVLVDDEQRPWTREELVRKIGNGSFAFGLVVEAGFEERMQRGETPPLELLRDPSKTVESQVLVPTLIGGLFRALGPQLGRSLTRKGLDEVRRHSDAPLLAAAVGALEGPTARLFDLIEKEIAKEEATSRPAMSSGGGFSMSQILQFVGLRETEIGGGHLAASERRRLATLTQAVAGTAVMMLLFGLVACGITILAERDEGTLRRLLASPVPRGAILAGKFLFTFAVGLLQMVVLFTFGALVFGLPVLNVLPGVVVVTVALTAAATGIGVFLATIGRTQRQIEGVSTLIILLMSSIGGSWWPLFLMPDWMQIAGHFTLNAWAMDGYHDVFWRQESFVHALPECGVLLGIAMVLFALAVWAFRRRILA